MMLLLSLVLGASLFSGCAHFKTLPEGKAFLAEEKAAGKGNIQIKQESGPQYIPRLDSAGNVALGAVAAVPFVSLTGTAVQIAAGTTAVVRGATTPIQNLWVAARGEYWYDHYIPVEQRYWDPANDRDTKSPLYRQENAVSRAMEYAGPPPTQCEVVMINVFSRPMVGPIGKSKGLRGHVDAWADPGPKIAVDKKEGSSITMSRTLRYSVSFRTRLPEGATEDTILQPEMLCTTEVLEPHVEKMREYLRSL